MNWYDGAYMTRSKIIMYGILGVSAILLIVVWQEFRPVILHVAPELRPYEECGGLVPHNRLVVNGECFFDSLDDFISKFEHEEGTEYRVLAIRTKFREDATDSPNYNYKVVWVVSANQAR